jgi:hypothetical protein
MICRGLLRRLVVTCIGTSRKIKPVVGEPELLKTPLQVITARAATQTEKTSSSGLGETKMADGYRVRRGPALGLSPRTIEDDHIPFLEPGVLAVDTIDLDYGPFDLYWHSRYDTVDKCSPASLAVAARVVLATLAALETNLHSRPEDASS